MEDFFFGQIEGEIVEDQVGVCVFDSVEVFQNYFFFIDSVCLGSKFDYCVFFVDLIGVEWQIVVFVDIVQNIQVGVSWFYYQVVGVLGFIEQ